MTGAGVSRRVGRIASAREEVALDAEVRRLAAHLGIPASELRGEVQAVERLCREARAFTVESRVAAVARDLGMPVAELRAEIDRLREAADATA